MEAQVTLIVLYLLAAWTWACLVWVADHGLPTAIRVQQGLGAYTPRRLYRVARRGHWLAVGGVVVAGAGLIAGLGAGVAVGLLAVAIFLLTYLLAGMSKLLHPRVVAAILARPDASGPDEPLPVA